MPRQLKYQEIESFLLEELSSGRFGLGDHFHTDLEIAGRFHVTNLTVRKAFAAVETRGYVVRRRGVGTIVMRLPSRPRRLRMMQRCLVGVVFNPSKLELNYKLATTMFNLSLALEAAGYLALPVSQDISSLQEAGVSGTILAEPPPKELFEKIHSLGIPMVAMGIGINVPDVPRILEDDMDGARKIVAFLAARGHRHLLFTGYGTGVPELRQTMDPSLSNETAHAGMTFQMLESGPEVTDEFLALFADPTTRPDAVLLANAFCMKPLLAVLTKFGLLPGRDISVLIRGAAALTMTATPPWSIIDEDIVCATRQAVELLQEVIREPGVHHDDRLVPFDIVRDRGSVMRHA